MLLSGIQRIYKNEFPLKTGGNDGDQYRDNLALNTLILLMIVII